MTEEKSNLRTKVGYEWQFKTLTENNAIIRKTVDYYKVYEGNRYWHNVWKIDRVYEDILQNLRIPNSKVYGGAYVVVFDKIKKQMEFCFEIGDGDKPVFLYRLKKVDKQGDKL